MLKPALVGLTALIDLVALAASAQTPTQAPASAIYLSVKDIDGRIGHPGPDGAVVTSMIDRHETYYSQLASRTTDGVVESHAHWVDLITILSGEATLTVGGQISGNTVDDKGESHGGVQAGGRMIALHAGDYVQIPAGAPHRMTGPKNGFRYLVVKVRD